MREVDRSLRNSLRVRSGGRFHIRIEDIEILALLTVSYQQLLAVERNLITLHVGHHGLRLVAFVCNVETLQRQLGWLLLISVHPAQPLLGGLQAVVIARRRGNLAQPRRHVGEVNLHLRRFLLFLFLLLLSACGFVFRSWLVVALLRLVSLVIVPLLFVLLLFVLLVGIKLVRGQERRPQAGR